MQVLSNNCDASSEFVSSSIPSWQILTAHAQPFRGARDLAFCLKVPLDSLLVWASSGSSGETARMRRLAWTFAARTGDKYQIRLTRPNCFIMSGSEDATSTVHAEMTPSKYMFIAAFLLLSTCIQYKYFKQAWLGSEVMHFLNEILISFGTYKMLSQLCYGGLRPFCNQL